MLSSAVCQECDTVVENYSISTSLYFLWFYGMRTENGGWVHIWLVGWLDRPYSMFTVGVRIEVKQRIHRKCCSSHS